MFKESRSWAHWSLLVVAILAAAFKNYSLWSDPRFYAEEGRAYFACAYQHGIWTALLAPHQGYYCFWTNLSTLIAAKCFPLYQAPLVTQIAGLICIALVLSIVMSSRLRILASLQAKFLVALAIVLVDGGEGMVLSSLSAQFHFGIAGMILLLELVENACPKRSSIVLLPILAVCALSSPLVCLLTPFFFFAYLKTRTKPAGWALFLTTTAGALQFMASQIGSASTPSYLADRLSLIARLRGLELNLALPSTLINGFLSPFLSHDQVIYLGIHTVHLSQESPVILMFLNFFVVAILIGATWAYLRSKNHRGPLLVLFIGLFFMFCGSVLTFSDMQTQLIVGQPDRYLYCSTVALLMVVISKIDWSWNSKTLNLLMFALLLLPFYQGIERIRMDQSSNQEWSNWKTECEKHRDDPHLGLKTWPRPWILLIDEWDYQQPFKGRPIAESLSIEISGEDDAQVHPRLSVTPPIIGKDVQLVVATSRPNTSGSLLWYQGKAKRSIIGLSGHKKLELYIPSEFAEKNRINFTTGADGTWTHTFHMSDFYFRRNWYFCYQAVLVGSPMRVTNAVQTKVGYEEIPRH